MADQPTAEGKQIDRRDVLRAGAALTAAGPALLHGADPEAQPRPSGASPMTIIDSQVHAYAANTPAAAVGTACPTGRLTSPATRWWRR